MVKDVMSFEELEKVTLAEFYEFWLEKYRESGVMESTVKKTNDHFKCHILPSLGKKPLGEITTNHCLDAFKVWAGKTSKASNALSKLADVFSLASELNGKIENPATMAMMYNKNILKRQRRKEEDKKKGVKSVVKSRVKPIATPTKYARVYKELSDYNADQICKLVQVINNEGLENQLRFKLLITTGIKVSELNALEWSDFELSKGVVQVNKGVGEVAGGGKEVLAYPINKRRYIKLHPSVVNLVASLYGERKNNLVFSNKDGEHYSNPSVNARFKRIIQKNDLPNFATKELRFIAACYMFSKNVSLRQVKKYFGSSDDLQTTQMHYKLYKERYADLNLDDVL